MSIAALACGSVCAAPKSDEKSAAAAAESEKNKPEAKSESKTGAAADKKAGSSAPSVKVERKGNYLYWFTYKDEAGEQQSTLPLRFKGKSTNLDTQALGDKYSKAKLHVMDRATGNMAMVYFPGKDPKAPIELKSSDFEYVRGVRLRIVSESGKPLESAIVTITDGENNTMKAVVTPADEGVAVFQNVASGTMTVHVEANGIKSTLDRDVEVPDKRSSLGFARDVKVSGDVDTLDIAQSAPPTGEGAAPAAGPGGSLLQTIAGLLLLIVVGSVVYIVLKSRGMTAAKALKGLGVQLPGEPGGPGAPMSAGQPAAPAIDPNVCEFCGQRKDANGQCACTIAPGASPFTAPAQPAGAGPRLIGMQGTYSGHIFELKSASAVVGREDTNEVALPNDTTASRRHATISSAGGTYLIRDEGSSNGTFVNGAKITEQRLTPGDEIQVGGTKFRFEV